MVVVLNLMSFNNPISNSNVKSIETIKSNLLSCSWWQHHMVVALNMMTCSNPISNSNVKIQRQ